jgi:hypothetical protein
MIFVNQLTPKLYIVNSLKRFGTSFKIVMKEIQKTQTTKLQTYRGRFEQLKMKEDENIAAYFLRVDETVNAIIGLGEEIKECVIVQKVLTSLPMRFDSNISALEKRAYRDSISMDKIHGIFIAYEMRTEHENPYIKEESFKASKRSKKKGKKKEKEHSNNSDISEDDEEMGNFVRRLNKGTNDIYKGKFPLICFNCDGIGHFANKFPHSKNKRNDEDYSNNKQTCKGKRTTKKVFKKILCTKEDISSSDEDEVSGSEATRVIFMEVEDSDKEDTKEEYQEAEEEYEEAKVDYREELLCAIEVIRREKKKNKNLQAELNKKENTQELEKMITNLKVQIEEDKRIEEALK